MQTKQPAFALEIIADLARGARPLPLAFALDPDLSLAGLR